MTRALRFSIAAFLHREGKPLIHEAGDDRWVTINGRPVRIVNGKLQFGNKEEKLQVYLGPQAGAKTFKAGRADPDQKTAVKFKSVRGETKTKTAYGEKHKAKSAKAKFARTARALLKHSYMDGVLSREANGTDRRTKTRTVATALLLIQKTGIRPSDEEGGATWELPPDKEARLEKLKLTKEQRQAYMKKHQVQVQTFGALSLQKRHIKINGSSVSIKFMGKKNQKYDYTTNHPGLAKALKSYVDAAPSPTSPVFTDESGEAVSNNDVRSRLRKFHPALNTKDLRTARAQIAVAEVRKAIVSKHKGPMPKTRAEAKKKARDIINAVASHVCKVLGNTAAVSRSSYINPTVWEGVLRECGYTAENARSLSEGADMDPATLAVENEEDAECPILRALFGDDEVDQMLSDYAEGDPADEGDDE